MIADILPNAAGSRPRPLTVRPGGVPHAARAFAVPLPGTDAAIGAYVIVENRLARCTLWGQGVKVRAAKARANPVDRPGTRSYMRPHNSSRTGT
ncbi:MAG: hypothetical protein AAF205_05475 [Pseudomonadota bacterium]